MTGLNHCSICGQETWNDGSGEWSLLLCGSCHFKIGLEIEHNCGGHEPNTSCSDCREILGAEEVAA